LVTIQASPLNDFDRTPEEIENNIEETIALKKRNFEKAYLLFLSALVFTTILSLIQIFVTAG